MATADKVGVVNGYLVAPNHAAAQMHISTPGTVSIGTGGTYQKVAGGAIVYTGEHLEDFHEDVDGRLTYIGVATKEFLVSAAGSIESGEIAQLVNVAVAQDGSEIANSDVQADFSAVSNHTPFALEWFVTMATGSYIEIFVTSNTNGDDVIFHSLVVTIDPIL